MDMNPNHIWYPGEDICGLKECQSLDWIRMQKRIVKKCGNPDYFFNVVMLNAISRVTKGIVGANPDECHADKKWVEGLKNKLLFTREKRAKERHNTAKEKGSKEPPIALDLWQTFTGISAIEKEVT